MDSVVTIDEKPQAMFNGEPFEVSIRPRTTSTSDNEIHCDSVIEMQELKRRKNINTQPNVENGCDNFGYDQGPEIFLYEKEIRPNDTLQNIALTHHVTLAELKRANNLITEQDFYALRYIKVPLKKHGILSEQFAQASGSDTSLSNIKHHNSEAEIARRWDVSPDGSQYGDLNDNYEADSDDSSETRSLLVRTLSIRDAMPSGKQSAEAKKFLQKMDMDLEKIRDSTNSYKGSLNEVTATLTCKRITPIATKSAWNGADCGIRWWSALLCMVIVGILIPIVYFVMYEYKQPS